MSTPFFGPQGRNINKLDSLSLNTLNTGFVYIDSGGTVTTKKISTNEIADSVNLPGVPTTATASKGTNTTQIATTAYVQEAIADIPPNTGTTDATKVSLTGDETISGTKTFSGSIVTPTATISGNTFQNNTVYINGGFYWRIKEIITSSVDSIITLRDLGFPYYHIYTLNCTGNTRILLDIPSEDIKGVSILFKKKTNNNFWFYTSTGSYILYSNSMTLNNEIVVGNTSNIMAWELICDGTYWYLFNIV